MKKAVATLSLACLLLTACNSTPTLPPNSDTDISMPTASSDIQSTGAGVDYDVRLNPYNTQTAMTEEYIFTVGLGAIYRIDRQSGVPEEFISEEAHDIFLGRAIQTIATYDDFLYFVSPNHLFDLQDQTTIDTFELRLFRADIHDGAFTQVGVVGNGVYTLNYLEGYLIAHHLGDLPDMHDVPEMSKDEAFKVFVPDANASLLEEPVYTSLAEETQKSIEHFIYAYLDSAALEERLYGGTIEVPFNPVHTNDAYYFFDFMSHRLNKAPLDEGAAEEVSLSDDVQASLQNHTQIIIKNYDADWLYCTDENTIFRLRKDGSEYQLLVNDGADVNGPLDVIDGHIFYKGADGQLYMDNNAIGAATY